MRRMTFLLLAGVVMAIPPAHAAPLHAFTTSTFGPGDMHSWSEVAGTSLTGLAAADGICRARAADAGLTDPDAYVAWLSDRNTDAYCRVFGLTGKKADNCGQASLPVGAGPWLRVDGVPFAGTIEAALADNLVYSSLNVDEFGDQFHDAAESFTATDVDGTFNTVFRNNADCNQWTSAVRDPFGPFPSLGSNLASGGWWTFDEGGVSCDGTRRLTCMQKGRGSPLMGQAQFGHREAFVTSADVTGDLGGIAGADATCQALAASANLQRPEAFKALLASSTSGLNITDRIQHDGPWYRRDGLLFAHNKAELIGGAVTLPLNVTERGEYLAKAVALTGALENGVAHAGFDCYNWALASGSLTSAALVNSVAFAPSGGTNWLGVAQVGCGAPTPPYDTWPRKLFCLSDADDETASARPSISAGFSGNWSDPSPSQGGHGLQIEVLPNNGILAIWFVFNPAGTAQNWIYAQGRYDPASNAVTLAAFLEQGGAFPPRFDANNVTATPWGSLTFTFSDCNNGSVTWTSNATSAAAGYHNVNFPIRRLTSLAGVTCH